MLVSERVDVPSMSSLREKIEKKKNKYLEAAKNLGKGKNKKDDDEGQDGSDVAVDEPDDVGVDAPKPDTPYKARASAVTSPATPSKGDKGEKDGVKDDKTKEKEVWKYEGEYNAEGEARLSLPLLAL